MGARRHGKLALVVSALLFVCSGVGYGVYWYMKAHATQLPQPTAINKVEPPVPTPASLESKVLVMGDVYWGRYINDWSMASPLKYAYPFQRLNEFGRDKYDAWVANMECPITNNPKVSSALEDTYLKFDCSPAYLPEAKKYFTAVSLANNHTDNQGAAGFTETEQHLDENGIQHFGGYDPEDYDNICDVISLPARIGMTDGTTKQAKLPVVWCGYNGVFRIPSAASVAVIRRYSSLFEVIALPHSGTEYKSVPDEIKTTLYHALIDGGADVVLGGHPHWIQNSEAYKGKLIVYSMGNFIFDQQGGNEVTRSAVVSMTLSVDAASAPDLAQWIALGESCSTYHDDCLAKATEQHLTKLPLKLQFSVLGSNDSGKVTHIASDAELASIKQRLNWQQTIQGLSGYNSGH